MIIFDERKYRDNLKATLGFQDIPDEELYDHNLVLNSPMGGKNALSLSVGKYIDTDVEMAREAYNNLADTFDDVEIPELAPVEEGKISVLSNKTTFDGSKIKYFDIDVPDDEGGISPFTVAIYVNSSSLESIQESKNQIQQVTNHFTFVGERKGEDLTGLERIISYYQFVNLVGKLVHQSNRDDVAARIAEKIAMEFEGDLALEDIKKQFGF